MDDKTTDILERTKLRREALLKRAKEEGIDGFKISQSPLLESALEVPTITAKSSKSSMRRSNSFSDLSHKPVKDRLLSWKIMEKQQIEKANKISPAVGVIRSQVCGSLTNINEATQNSSVTGSSIFRSDKASAPLNDKQTPYMKRDLLKDNRLFPSYLSRDALNAGENKENTLTKTHYHKPKFGPFTASKMASIGSTAQTSSKPSGGIKKLGPATQEIQEKLSKLCQESWKRNQIAEDIQKKKDEDMKLLTARWKNGILCGSDDDGDVGKLHPSDDCTKKESTSHVAINGTNEIPVPPPLPAFGEIQYKDWKNRVALLSSDQNINSSRDCLNFSSKNCILPAISSKTFMEMPGQVKSSIISKDSKTNIKKTNFTVSKPLIQSSTSPSHKKTPYKDQSCKVLTSKTKAPSMSGTKTVGTAIKSVMNSSKFNSVPKPFLRGQLEKKFAPVGAKVTFACGNNDSVTSGDSFTEAITDDFKKNLRAMGYQTGKSDRNEVVVELESAPEEEAQPMDVRHELEMRLHPPTNKARVQSHIEETQQGRKSDNLNKVTGSRRPISMVDHRDVVTKFNDHDIVTVLKKKLVKVNIQTNRNNGNSKAEIESKKSETNKSVANPGPQLGKSSKKDKKLLANNKIKKVNVKCNHHNNIRNSDNGNDDTYGLDEVQCNSTSGSDSISCGSLTVEGSTNVMETYFSITDVQANHKRDDDSQVSDDVYIQMSGAKQKQYSSDDVSDDCYAATEGESDVYEEIRDPSLTPKAIKQTKRHVSMRRAIKSCYSDDASETDEEDHEMLLRNKTEKRVERAQPITTANACFNPTGYSSPLPPNMHKSNLPINDFGGLCVNIATCKNKSSNIKHKHLGHRTNNSCVKTEEFSAPTGTLARLATASHHVKRDEDQMRNHEDQMRNHVEQFLDRRGLLSSPSPCRKTRNDHKAAHSPQCTTNPVVPVKSAKVKMQGLEELIEQEERFSIQASNALNICMKKSNLWTAEAVECHRILLTTSKRREILLNELKRLKEGTPGVDSNDLPVVGKLTVNGIRLPLKPEFIAKLGTQQDTTVTYFVVTIQSGETISSSQTVSTKDRIILGGLEVPGQLILAGVPSCFKALLEVYALTVPRDMKCTASKKVFAVRKATENASKRFSYKTDSEDEQNIGFGLRTSYFLSLGRLELDENHLTRGHFSLEGVNCTSPLQGSVHLKMKHIPESAVHYRGYLGMCLEGSREFTRRWCCLTQSEINIWKNASDELIKEPVMQIDLMSCITEMLVPIPINYRSQRDTFEMVIIIQSSQGAGRINERMSVKSSTPLNLQQIRYWFSADSAEECGVWCNLINNNLHELRTWHPYAVPPVKFKTPRVSSFTFDSLL